MLSTKTRQLLLIAFTSIHLLLSNVSYSQAGRLDPCFGNGGFSASAFSLGKLRIQSDRKLIALGYRTINGNTQAFLTRFTSTGMVDGSFGNGYVPIPVFIPSSIALQSDGKIVAVGTVQQDFAVMRFNPNGSIDNSFGQNGMVQTNIFIHTLSDGTKIFSSDQANSVEVQSDGKIVVAGSMFENYSLLNHFAVVRYNSNGTLDASFAQQGVLVSALLRFGEIEKDMNLLSNGNILVYGSGVEPFLISVVGTYDANGNFISKYTTKSPGSSQSYSFGLGVNGLAYELLGYSSYIFTPTNKPDNYFIDGATGMIQLDPKYNRGSLQNVAIQNDGKVLVSGNWNAGLVMLRFNSNGSVDTSFGTKGEAVFPFNVGTSLAITPAKAFNSGGAGIVSVLLQKELEVKIPDAYALPKGTAANTVYLGYASASAITLEGDVTGGSMPYTYHWSNGSTTSSIVVSPLHTTTYQLMVTDADQCTARTEKTVSVIDVRCGEKGDKVLVCKAPSGHPSNGSVHCISANAVPEQLKNGSYLGACKGCAFNDDQLMVEITPNPTSTEFTIRVQAEADELTHKIMLDVYNQSGQLIEEKQIATGQVIKFGSTYKVGMYMVIVRNEAETKVFKLLKIR